MFGFSPAELATVSLSLKVAFWCTVVSSMPAIAVAWVLARKQFFGKSLLDGVIHLPLVLPPIVPGYFLLVLLGRQGVIGRWLYETLGLTLVFTWQGAVIASAVMAFPLMVRAIRLAFMQIDSRLEKAAGTLGAPPWRVFKDITLPLAGSGMLTGFILAFSRSLGEFGATITFVGNIAGETRTLPLAIYTMTQTPGGEHAAMRLVLLSILIALIALICSNILEQRANRLLGNNTHHD